MIPFVKMVTPVDKPMVRIKFHHEEQVLWCHEVWWGILELWHASICLSWLCLEDIVWATQPFVTCYGGASSWASVIWKDYFAITVSEGSYHQNKTISIIFSTAEPFASTLSLMVDHYKSWEDIGLLWSQQRFKIWIIFCPEVISDACPLSETSGLSFDSPFLVTLLFFCLVACPLALYVLVFLLMVHSPNFSPFF